MIKYNTDKLKSLPISNFVTYGVSDALFNHVVASIRGKVLNDYYVIQDCVPQTRMIQNEDLLMGIRTHFDDMHRI